MRNLWGVEAPVNNAFMFERALHPKGRSPLEDLLRLQEKNVSSTLLFEMAIRDTAILASEAPEEFRRFTRPVGSVFNGQDDHWVMVEEPSIFLAEIAVTNPVFESNDLDSIVDSLVLWRWFCENNLAPLEMESRSEEWKNISINVKEGCATWFAQNFWRVGPNEESWKKDASWMYEEYRNRRPDAFQNQNAVTWLELFELRSSRKMDIKGPLPNHLRSFAQTVLNTAGSNDDSSLVQGYLFLMELLRDLGKRHDLVLEPKPVLWLEP